MKPQRRIEFHPPAGAVPEGTQANDEFDLVCTFKVKSDGQVCLVVMGDKQLPGYAERDKGKPDYSDEHKEMMKGTGGGEVQSGYG